MNSPDDFVPVVSLIRGPLVGTCVACVLYGVTCLQAFFYYQTYVQDRKGLKATVTILLAFETVHAALSIWVVDTSLVTASTNPYALQSATWLTTAMYIIGFCTDVVVYFYFTWRIWMFTKKLWIVFFMMSVAVSRTVISIAACFLSILSPTWISYLERSKDLILTANALFILGDAFSASIMAYYLHKSREGAPSSPRTNLLINRLLAFAVATGWITVLVDIIALALTLAQPRSLSFTGAILVQTRLYANSFLASLNIRNANARAYENAEGTPLDLTAVPIEFARPSQPTMDGNMSAVADETVHEPQTAKIDS